LHTVQPHQRFNVFSKLALGPTIALMQPIQVKSTKTQPASSGAKTQPASSGASLEHRLRECANVDIDEQPPHPNQCSAVSTPCSLLSQNPHVDMKAPPAPPKQHHARRQYYNTILKTCQIHMRLLVAWNRIEKRRKMRFMVGVGVCAEESVRV
jgi:hypothetical protein